jgi:hypothetical protein
MMIPERYKRKEANPMDVSRSLFFDATSPSSPAHKYSSARENKHWVFFGAAQLLGVFLY